MDKMLPQMIEAAGVTKELKALALMVSGLLCANIA